MRHVTLICAVVLAAVGCAHEVPLPPVVDTSRTTVILLPDEDGHVGAVTVTANGASQQVDAAYAATAVSGADGRPSEPQSMDEAQVLEAYQDVMQAQPSQPARFILYFTLDGTALTDESSARLPAVLAAALARQPTEIFIFGHTDATGSDVRNLQLSADRARAVERLLRNGGLDTDAIETQFFGSQDPLVPTPPNVPEPKNRRVEILIL